MNEEKIVQIFGGIDEKYIREANEAMNFWLGSQEGEIVRADGSHRFLWRAVIASVACTAATLFGVFVLLLNIGKIGVVNNPASSVSEPANSFDSQSTVMPDVFFEEAAYAYDWEDLEELKRYEVGDKLGENATIASAKTTYKISDGTPVMQKQEIVLDLEKDLWYHGADGSTYIILPVNRTNELGLPSFAKEAFEIKPIYFALTDENTHGEGSYACITLYKLKLTVDYESKGITIYPRSVSVDLSWPVQ